jgi:hypothetical protein
VNLYFFTILLFAPASFFAAQESKISVCEKISMSCNVWISKNILGMSDQDIMVQAAQKQNTRPLELCIALEIGKINKKDSEGHTPKSAARLLGNTKVLDYLQQISPTSVACRKKYKPE